MSERLRIGFIGAGAVNFGGGEGPWDHATRLEKIGGIEVVGIADPDVERARAKLAERDHRIYAGVEVFGDFREMVEKRRPDAVWIGVPPNAHGTEEAEREIEVYCAEAGVDMFVEKPLSAFPPERVRPVVKRVEGSGVMTGVGSEETQVLRFGDDDAYLAEDVAFVEALRSGDRGKIRSSYGDAFGTHRLTWAIADATE